MPDAERRRASVPGASCSRRRKPAACGERLVAQALRLARVSRQTGGLMRKCLMTVCLLLCASVAGLALPVNQPVKVTGGLVTGTAGREASITVFKGIPYAAPPTGERRWKEPGPVTPWTGVRAADRVRAELHPVDRAGAQALDVRVHGAQRDQRGLPAPERVDGGEVGQRTASGVRVHLRRRVHRGVDRGAGLRRRGPGARRGSSSSRSTTAWAFSASSCTPS